MAEYYSTRPPVAPIIVSDPDTSITVSEFDKHHEALLSNDVHQEKCKFTMLQHYAL
jgi:hypothetical protein